MGSIGKKLKKVVKKIGKVGKKILPIALPLAAMYFGGPMMAGKLGGTSAGAGLFGKAATGALASAAPGSLMASGMVGLPGAAASSGWLGAGGLFAPMKGKLATGLMSALKNPLSQKGLMTYGALGGGLLGAFGSKSDKRQGGGGGSNMAQPMYNSWLRDGMAAGYSIDEINDMYAPYGEMYGGGYSTKSSSDHPTIGVSDQFPGTNYQHQLYRYADGGRIGLAGGGGAYESWKDFVEPLMIEFPELEGMSNEEQVEFLRGKGMIRDDAYATGGRTGYNQGDLVQMASAPDPMAERMDTLENMALEHYGKSLNQLSPKEIEILEFNLNEMNQNDFFNTGGRVHKNIGGIMNAPALTTPGQPMMPPQGTQWDGRQGGFMPMGAKPQADDVPAMLSKDEFVMTRDAVKNMGDGDANIGAQRMYDLMNNLEARA